MAAWAESLLNDLDKADERARSVVSGLSVEQLNWQPGPNIWSVGQCVDHLCVMNEVYLPPIAKALEGKAKASVVEVTPGWFGSWFLKSFVEPSPETKKVKAPSKSAPASKVDGRILEKLLKGNNEVLRELIRRASEYDVNRIRFRNPFIPVIRFTVGTGLTIVVRHQHRHLLQAERVKSNAKFPQ